MIDGMVVDDTGCMAEVVDDSEGLVALEGDGEVIGVDCDGAIDNAD